MKSNSIFGRLAVMTTMSDVLLPEWAQSLVVMVWYDMVYVDLYSAIIAKLSNALYALCLLYTSPSPRDS